MGITASVKAWWTKDTALHAFIFSSFLVGIPGTIFSTYVIYQLQIVGFTIGTDAEGLTPCTTYCIVPWGNKTLDLNSVLLYLNALAFGLGGLVALLLCAYSDHWPKKHLLVTISIVLYGIFAIPAYWLQGYDARNFASLIALYVLFNIVTLVIMAVLSIYIPFCMRKIQAEREVDVSQERDRPADHTFLKGDSSAGAKRKYAFDMSVFGNVAVASGGTLVLVITIILARALDGSAAQTAGLLVTTVVGFVTIAGATVSYFGLPALPTKSSLKANNHWYGPLVEFFVPVKELVSRRSVGALLVAYTIYVDSAFAVSSVTAQLFVAQIRPSALEYSLYALAQSLFQLVLPLIFLWVRPVIRIQLEKWLIIGYIINLLVPIWGCVGLADTNFGFKMRWEFYCQLLLANIAGSIINTTFRVLFSEMLPPGAEVQWFSMQVVLSCATVWVNYVASGPLQNVTHNLRFPLVLSIVFLVCSLILELCRVRMAFFTKDRQRWYESDQIQSGRNSDSIDVVKASVIVKGV